MGALCLEKPISQSTLFNLVTEALGIQQQATKTADSDSAAISEAPSRLLRVLLAEDTPANQKLVTYVLSKRGHTVEVTQNGQQALEAVGQQDFDVVLMDVQMPVMDGFLATQAIRKLADPKKARLPIIAMTAHALKGDCGALPGRGHGRLHQQAGQGRGTDRTGRAAGNPERRRQATRRVPSGSRRAEAEDTQPPITNLQLLIPDSSPFNLDQALMRLGDESGLLREMVGFFFLDGLKLLAEIQAAAAAGDAAALETKAHRLKGTVVYLGADAAIEAIARVEALGHAGDLPGAAEAIHLLETEVLRLADALRPHRPPAQ